MSTYIINQNGKKIDYDVAVNLMDDELREQLANDRDWPTNEAFFAAYCAAHVAKYGAEFEPNKSNPVW